MADYAKRNAAKRTKLIGLPSPQWKTTDFDELEHSIAQYRGQVVILDFWYRGCGWCIRAMPQVKRIARDFKDRPVVVLGMNTDRKEEDARFVIDKMGLAYSNLRATGLPEKYSVSGFPTLIVIDPVGRVHDIHVGYSATLYEEVRGVIEDLLKK